MANHFPVVPLMQVSGVQYSIVVAAVSGVSATFPAGSLDLINRSFVTAGSDGSLVFDYSLFDQDTYEAQLRATLNQLCTVLGGNLGTGAAAVQAAMSVSRKWLFTGASQMGAGYPALEFDDQMPFP